MAMGLVCKVRIVTLALLVTAAAGHAQPAAVASTDFGTPVYDAVVPDAGGVGALTAYRFLGQHDWPAVRRFAAPPLDWSRAGSLALPFDNAADTAFTLLLRLDDRTDADGDDRSLTGMLTIPPRAHGTVVLPLDAAPIGMVARPPSGTIAALDDLLVEDVRGSVDLSHVTALHVSGVRTATDRQIRFGAPTLRPAMPVRRGPVADAFGQAIEGRWPEKVESVAALRTKLREAERQTRLLAQSGIRAADRFGGVDVDTRLRSTGFFRVDKIGGRWTLVTPAGHRFFSLGVDSVSPSNPTIVGGRRALFAALPDRHDALFRYATTEARSVTTFDFGEADLERGLGTGWRPLWRKQVAERLWAWGFNSLGNWSSADLTSPAALPYVEFYDVEGDAAKVPMPGGRALPDPFDPGFAGVADGVAAQMTAKHRGDPMLLGYFSGNELPWGTEDRPEQGIAAAVFGLGPNSPAKRSMVDGLRRRYGSVAAFSAAWDVPTLASWNDLLGSAPPWPPILGALARRDVVDFQRLFATLYFSTVAGAIRRHDPDHLYLGTRFADAPPEVVEACAQFCDLMSFNVYGRSPEERASAWRSFDRPVLIGEFHFGSTDRGSFWPGMVKVGGEFERGPAYAAYLAQAVDDPQIVGTHWYQYADEPLTGRPYDGENGHIGLVAVTDVPYAGFVAEVAAANRRASERFSAQGRPDLRGTQ